MKIHEIEKGIRIPPKRHGGFYPLNRMAVNDSFLVSSEGESLLVLLRRINGSIYRYGKANNMKFVTRTMKDENGIRVWRVK